MVQNTDVFGHVPGDQEAIQNAYTYYTFMGWRPGSDRHPIYIVPCVDLLDSFLAPWHVAEDIGFLYHVSLSVLSPTPGAYQAWRLITPEIAASLHDSQPQVITSSLGVIVTPGLGVIRSPGLGVFYDCCIAACFRSWP